MICNYHEEDNYFTERAINYIRNLTKGNIIVLGRKLFEELRELYPLILQESTVVVLSKDKEYKDFDKGNIVVFNEIEPVIKQCLSFESNDDKEVFVLGGRKLNKQMINYVDNIHVIQENDNEFTHESFELTQIDTVEDIKYLIYKRI